MSDEFYGFDDEDFAIDPVGKYTPGPWRYEEAEFADDGDFIEGTVWADGDGTSAKPMRHVAIVRIGLLPETNPNGYLIAAAPDLLEALQNLRVNACQLGDFIYGAVRECSQDMIRVIDAAIAKAEGVPPKTASATSPQTSLDATPRDSIEGEVR